MNAHEDLDRHASQPKDPDGLIMSDRAVEATGPRLKDGSPLHYAFIPEDKLVLKAADVEGAKNMLDKCADVDPAAVASCAGKTAEEARHILWGILGH